MKFAYGEISGVFELGGAKVPTLVIENQRLFRSLLMDIYLSIEGADTAAVLSEDNQPISMSKNAELLADFISFSLNRKALLGKICAAMEQVAIEAENFHATQTLLAELENRIVEWSFGLNCHIAPAKISVASLLKSAGVELVDDYQGERGEAERILDYMELVREFDRDKMFVTLNMRDFYGDEVMADFLQSVCAHEFRVLMIESKARPRLKLEQRWTVDEDLCEF